MKKAFIGIILAFGAAAAPAILYFTSPQSDQTQAVLDPEASPPAPAPVDPPSPVVPAPNEDPEPEQMPAPSEREVNESSRPAIVLQPVVPDQPDQVDQEPQLWVDEDAREFRDAAPQASQEETIGDDTASQPEPVAPTPPQMPSTEPAPQPASPPSSQTPPTSSDQGTQSSSSNLSSAPDLQSAQEVPDLGPSDQTLDAFAHVLSQVLSLNEIYAPIITSAAHTQNKEELRRLRNELAVETRAAIDQTAYIDVETYRTLAIRLMNDASFEEEIKGRMN